MDTPLVDYKGALSDLDNDKLLYRELLDCWFSEVPFDKNILNSLTAQNKLSEAASYVHRIKGAAGSLGAHSLFQAAQKVENILRGRSEEDLDSNLNSLYNIYEHTNSEFRELQKNL